MDSAALTMSCSSSSLINSEFKFDLADYLARHPNAPVKSLGEVLDKGLHHLALEATFRARNAPEKRETDQYRRALIRRDALRSAVSAVLDEHRLAALLYPTIRRKPARIGDGQAGSTCQLSAHTGLPALGLPAGWTDDGLPVGMDLLGPAWSEANLLALGFSIEQTMKFRRSPFSTPALVGGKAPVRRRSVVGLVDGAGPVGELTLSFDPVVSELHYRVSVAPRRREDVTAIWIHRNDGKSGAALYPLYGGAAPDNGTVRLSSRDREDLALNQLQVRIYTRQTPHGHGSALGLP